MVARLRAIAGVTDARRIGVDALSPRFERLLREIVPGAEIVGVEDTMRGVRRRKLPAEVVCLRTAAAIAEGALWAAAAEVRPGVTEHHLRAAFLERMCQLGTSQFAQQGTFTELDPGAPLRWTTSKRRLGDGTLVALAGGALWAGYEGSLARTWWCGTGDGPTPRQRAVFTRWRSLLDGLIERCRAGATGADLRAAYEEAGGPEPQMSIAYSVGLGHEGPLAGPGMTREVERAQHIEADMVVALRAYVTDDDGACFGEDMVLVTEDGPEPLTAFGDGPLAG
jgi:Xaa-Pro aminopeptidase